jgi:hypothetical protein
MACGGTLQAQEPHPMMDDEPRRLRSGRPITPEQFEALEEEELERLVPKAWRDCFPGKYGCDNGSFYLHDGRRWSFLKADFVDD